MIWEQQPTHYTPSILQHTLRYTLWIQHWKLRICSQSIPDRICVQNATKHSTDLYPLGHASLVYSMSGHADGVSTSHSPTRLQPPLSWKLQAPRTFKHSILNKHQQGFLLHSLTSGLVIILLPCNTFHQLSLINSYISNGKAGISQHWVSFLAHWQEGQKSHCR